MNVLTRQGEKYWTPEPLFVFATAFVMRKSLSSMAGELEVLWVLQKDRQAGNWWTPPGGELDLPAEWMPGDFLDPSEGAIRESLEEVGIIVEAIGSLPPKMMLGSYPYKSELENSNQEMVSRAAAHSLFLYFPCRLVSGEAQPMAQASEPDYEIVDLCWFTFREFEEALEDGRINVYQNLVDIMRQLQAQVEAGHYNEALG